MDDAQGAVAVPGQRTERINKKISAEMSELTVYCRATVFNRKQLELNGPNPREMCSFTEQKAEKEIFSQFEFFNCFHKVFFEISKYFKS